MAGPLAKALQMRLLDVINCNLAWSRKALCILLVALPVYSVLLLLASRQVLITSSLRGHAPCAAPEDNIGGRSYPEVMCMPTVDVVYTWVNGSDPRWLNRMRLFRAAHSSANVSLAAGNGTQSAQKDDVAGANRYRDNDELRYSLRSVEKYAPWIRRIYIVTDNQVPSWLDVTHPRVHIVSHEEIFLDTRFLPTFSSPAIEANIHRIPGVSRHILYLNDDVMFGAPVMPTDFFTPSGGQKLYLAWDLPSCNEGCEEAWIGDGYCDAACNVVECRFDAGDCGNETDYGYSGGMDGDYRWGNYDDGQEFACAPSCPKTWLGDNTCDDLCNVPECLYDMLDCSKERESIKRFPLAYLELDGSETDVIRIPYGAKALAVDFSHLMLNKSDSLEAAEVVMSELVGKAVVKAEQKLLLIVFRRKEHAAEAFQVWGGPSPCEFERLHHICYSDRHDESQLAGCSNKFGCETETSLEAALRLCSVRGEECGGVTEDHDGQYQTRKGELLPSVLGESAWLKQGCDRPDSQTHSTCSSNSSVARETTARIVSFRLRFAFSGDTRFDITGALPIVEEHVRSPARRLVGGPSRRNRHLITSIVLEDTMTSSGLEHNLDHGVESKVRRLDTFGDSLRYVNSIYNSEFGYAARRVPAHMPHFLQREEIKRMQERFPKEFEATSSHRFRSGEDMQFSFAYMYWLVHESTQPAMSVEEFFHQELDADKDGKLSVNEIRTLVAVASGSEDIESVLPNTMAKILQCLNRTVLSSMTFEQFKNCKIAGKF